MADPDYNPVSTDERGRLDAEMEELSDDDLEGVAGGWTNDHSDP